MMIEIYSAKNKNLTDDEFNRLYAIIVKAYADTEAEMWGPNYVRISEFDFKEFIEADQILVAYLNHQVAGGIRYYLSSADVYSFGSFGADFKFKGNGIGRALINRVEEEVLKRGCHKIKIEILKPRDFDLPIKLILHNWYQQLGYRYSGAIDFAKEFPEKSKATLVPCVFDYYEKRLEP